LHDPFLMWDPNLQFVGIESRKVFVGQHGSWNRKPRSGYKVVFVPFRTV